MFYQLISILSKVLCIPEVHTGKEVRITVARIEGNQQTTELLKPLIRL
ncbi:hypothetical protein [Litorilituus lipolyticus]|nr:hypothetical protein [Litorilituus lipolyticus]